ncbi:uncharacterized protein LAESUDRAFT_120495 [Laetiporus sulphureus 93-53]|uniref:Uncharacterized protein n=1 Tax=Laetiporus sulphureus 93-53 TaxID=1314785 RepID=A0A165EKD4_9APHY|nr:uncharacterized protein LAESUDRAFT_120495 [Laetiporus sulphureus 93-53]KZT07238.1 hypothetical protein LAESUDRAFT_120495 [Laetiporus sulphureus 93-53]
MANSSVDSFRPVENMAFCHELHLRSTFQTKEAPFTLRPPSWSQGGYLNSGDLRLQQSSSSVMLHDRILRYLSSIMPASDVSPKIFHAHCALPLHQNRITASLMPLKRTTTTFKLETTLSEASRSYRISSATYQNSRRSIFATPA